MIGQNLVNLLFQFTHINWSDIIPLVCPFFVFLEHLVNFQEVRLDGIFEVQFPGNLSPMFHIMDGGGGLEVEDVGGDGGLEGEE
jgi:hypothetical protein